MKNLIAGFNRLPDNAKGALILLLASFGFSAMALLIKVAGERLHVTQIILIRQCVMAAIMTPTIVRSFPGSLKTTRPLLQLTRIATALVAMLMGFTAIIKMPIADATAIGFAKSFFVTIFAIVILHERVGMRRWIATTVGFAGVLIMLQPGGESFSIYGVYAAIGASAAGLVMVILRLLSRTESPATILIYQAIGVGLILLAPAIYFWQPPTTTEWLLMTAVGVTGYCSQMANIYAYKFGEASLLAPLEYTRLIYATLFGIVVFSEFPGMTTVIGALVVIVAAVYTVHRETVLKKARVHQSAT